MGALELLVPPPVVALIVGSAMWGVSLIAPSLEIPALIRNVSAAIFAVAGACVDLAAIVSFRLARTTINPMKPATTSSLVRSGIYGVTRNPMYLGLFFFLMAWAVYLSSAWALLGPVAFVLYINRFQIAPEEKALSAMFGADFTAYKSKVRRWL
jgi:protein-S-isoprenylcysteine O-methyltransferase Ste14